MEPLKEIFKIKMAIIVLADYLEDPQHSDYKVKEGILKILEQDLQTKKISLWKKLLMTLKTVVSAVSH